MRIAFVTDMFEGGIGGGVVSAVRLVAELRTRHEVLVVATGTPGPDGVAVPGFQLPLRAMRDNGFVFGWPRREVLERVFAQVDVVHAHFPFLLGRGALAVARRLGVPSVAAFHVQPENLLYNVGVRSAAVARFLYRYWLRPFYNGADAVVSPSLFGAERLRAAGVRSPIRVVSNGIPPQLAANGRPHHAAGPGQAITVLAVGRLAREKRQDVIIEAMAHSRYRDRLRLVLAGAGPEHERLQALAGKAGVHAEVGYVSNERMAALLREAHVFVHASEVELEGMAVLEAMAAGLPVLVADATESAARNLQPDRALRFRAGDPRDLAARLDGLVEQPEALEQASMRSLEQSRWFDTGRSAQQLESAYESVVHGAPRLEPLYPSRPSIHGSPA